MFLGIEIGGTKLQLGIGDGTTPQFTAFRRLAVDVERGASGILEQIAGMGRELIDQHAVRRIGVGFGGPVDASRGITTKSHQISGWENFPLVDWCRTELGLPAVLGNDCDVATLAEARYGAGAGKQSVFFVTVGTGVGGGCVLNGQLLGTGRPAIAEIGHLRPGPDAVDPSATVESVASGWGIAATARQLIERADRQPTAAAEQLRQACHGRLLDLNAALIAQEAARGNEIARQALDRALRTLGWGIAQVLTLLAPQVVVVGGGVTQMGEEPFFRPLRDYVAQYVFPPLADSYDIVPAKLGESVVVHGAIALAHQAESEKRL